MGEQTLKADDVDKLRDEVSRLEDEIHRITNKLQNDGFISRVPAALIEKEQDKLRKYEKACKNLKAQLQEVG